MFPQWSDAELERVIAQHGGDVERILPELLARPVSDAHLARFLSDATEDAAPTVAPLETSLEPPTYGETQATGLYPAPIQPRPRRRHRNDMSTPLLDSN